MPKNFCECPECARYGCPCVTCREIDEAFARSHPIPRPSARDVLVAIGYGVAGAAVVYVVLSLLAAAQSPGAGGPTP